MPYSQQQFNIPAYWTFYGHSYYQYSSGTRTQAGRADSMIRYLFDIQAGWFRNHAVVGSRLVATGNQWGGWPRVFQNENGVLFAGGWPYVAEQGAFMLGWGINDVLNNTNTVQNNTAYQQVMRAVISRCRCSVVYNSQDTHWSFGAAFALQNFTWDQATGAGYQSATSTTNANATLTLPADYHGETVVICLSSQPGIKGASWTFSGTAGVTGTISTSNIIASTVPAGVARIPVVRRITNLTAANASQTIVITATAIDAGGTADIDSAWLESAYPPAVLVANTARLLASGYALYPANNGDADVEAFNAYLPPLVAEFDQMVQIVDIDSALAKDQASLNFDGLHPTEVGAGRVAEAFLAAFQNLQPGYGFEAVQMNPSNRHISPLLTRRLGGFWYTSPVFGRDADATAYTAVAGDLFALPFVVQSGVESWSQWSVETLAGTVGASILFAVYDDRGAQAGPKYQYITPCTSAITLSNTPGVFNSTTTPAANGYLSNPVDPGIYWLVLLIVTAGTGVTFRTLKGPSSLLMPNLLATGGGGATATYVGYKATGQGSTLPGSWPFPNAPTFGASLVDNVPLIGIKTSVS
jgi:hypothetical protein